MGTVSGVVRWELGWMVAAGFDAGDLDLLCFGLVLLIPALGRFMCPLEVAGDLARCLRINFPCINGMPSSWSF